MINRQPKPLLNKETNNVPHSRKSSNNDWTFLVSYLLICSLRTFKGTRSSRGASEDEAGKMHWYDLLYTPPPLLPMSPQAERAACSSLRPDLSDGPPWWLMLPRDISWSEKKRIFGELKFSYIATCVNIYTDIYIYIHAHDSITSWTNILHIILHLGM